MTILMSTSKNWPCGKPANDEARHLNSAIACTVTGDNESVGIEFDGWETDDVDFDDNKGNDDDTEGDEADQGTILLDDEREQMDNEIEQMNEELLQMDSKQQFSIVQHLNQFGPFHGILRQPPFSCQPVLVKTDESDKDYSDMTYESESSVTSFADSNDQIFRGKDGILSRCTTTTIVKRTSSNVSKSKKVRFVARTNVIGVSELDNTEFADQKTLHELCVERKTLNATRENDTFSLFDQDPDFLEIELLTRHFTKMNESLTKLTI